MSCTGCAKPAAARHARSNAVPHAPPHSREAAVRRGRWEWALWSFALYAITLAPSTAFWDTSEYIATGAHSRAFPTHRGIRSLCCWRGRGSCSSPPPGCQWRYSDKPVLGVDERGRGIVLVPGRSHRVLGFFSEREERMRRVGAAGAAVLISVRRHSRCGITATSTRKVYTVSPCSRSRCCRGSPFCGAITSRSTG